MTRYLELHIELENRRAAALASSTSGPRVLVAGPLDTGKSSLCRLLVNYLARCGHKAVLVDLDISQGDISLPGTISSVAIHRPLGIEVPAACACLSLNMTLTFPLPLVCRGVLKTSPHLSIGSGTHQPRRMFTTLSVSLAPLLRLFQRGSNLMWSSNVAGFSLIHVVG